IPTFDQVQEALK
ncbi:hypothetical protein LHV07_06915, partial [Limosilactobacillus fermentum]|nr:hypothetical protein [Limosilactobacillus fermentum]